MKSKWMQTLSSLSSSIKSSGQFVCFNEHFNFLLNIPILSSMDTINNWDRCSFVESEIKIDELKIIFAECEKRLEGTVQTKEIFYQRSATLLTISITLLVSSIGYLGSQIQDFKFGIMNIILLASVFILWFICGTLKVNLNPVVFNVNGTLPEGFFDKKYFIKYDNDNKTSEERILLDLIIDYRSRIHKNAIVNIRISDNYKNAINALYALPCVAFLVCIIGYIFNLSF